MAMTRAKASQITTKLGSTGTVRGLDDKLRESVSVFDFMTVAQIADVQAGTASLDVSAAIQAAVSYAVANDKSVLIPAGQYRLTAPISITSQVTIVGQGTAVSRLLCVNTNAFNISAGVGFVNISGMTIAHAVRYTTTANTSTAINILGTTGSQCYWHTYADLFIDGFAEGFLAGGVCSSTWRNVTTVYTYKSVTFSAQCLNNAISQCRFGERDSGSIVPTAGSYGIKVGDGTINCEGLAISDSLVFGVRRALWVRASINVFAHHNIFDMIHEFGILAESTGSAGCINNAFTSNYIAITGAAGDCGIFLVNGYAPTDSQNRGTVVRDNEILAYPGDALGYGILVDGAEEERNTISGNRVQNAAVNDCRITAGSGHRVSDNLWRGSNGFSSTVRVSYINNFGVVSSVYPSSIGVFTPTVIGTTTPGAGTYDTQIGSYKIIDKMVYFNLRLAWSAHTGTGLMKIEGLPVACKNVAGYAPAVTVNAESMTFPAGATAIIGLINTGNTTIELRGSGNNLSPTPVDIDTAAAINISGFYEID
jgi:hypothetical protein